MESGRFKLFKHLNDWFDEFRPYHRKDGRVHKEGDDLMSATRLCRDDVALRTHEHSAKASLVQGICWCWRVDVRVREASQRRRLNKSFSQDGRSREQSDAH
jgi:hypothetical protein